MKRDIFDEMVQRWPSSLVARREVHKFTGGLLRPQSLANLDCLGKGPEERVIMSEGRKVAYPAQVLAAWLRGRCQLVNARREA